MSKAYVLFQSNLSDPEKLGLYIRNAAPTVLAKGGNVLVAAAMPMFGRARLPRIA